MKKGQRIMLLVDIETMMAKFTKGEELIITKVGMANGRKSITARNGFGSTVALREEHFKVLSK